MEEIKHISLEKHTVLSCPFKDFVSLSAFSTHVIFKIILVSSAKDDKLWLMFCLSVRYKNEEKVGCKYSSLGKLFFFHGGTGNAMVYMLRSMSLKVVYLSPSYSHLLH